MLVTKQDDDEHKCIVQVNELLHTAENITCKRQGKNMSTYKQLRRFKPEELLFNEAETRIVLKFIFKPTHHKRIDSLPMSDRL